MSKKYNPEDDKLYGFYKKVLASAFLQLDDDGVIRQAYDPKALKPLTKNGRILRISSPDAAEHAGEYLVHPFVEPISGNETPVMEVLRTAYANAICLRAIALITDALAFGASPAQHPQASGELSDLLMVVKDADAKMLDTWTSIFKISVSNPDKRFVHFYLKRQAKLDGKTYSRGCITTFPLYEELKKGERKFGTVSLRNKDRETIMKLMEYIFPGIGEPNRYSKGAQSDFGPYFNSLLQTVYGLFDNINEVGERLDEFIVDRAHVITDLSWYKELEEDFDSLVGSVRMWRVTKEETASQKAHGVAPMTTSQPSGRLAVAPPPIQAPALPMYPTDASEVQEVTSEGKLDYRAAMAKRNTGMMQAPQAAGQVYADPQGRQFMINPQGQVVYLQQPQQMQRPVPGPHQARTQVPAWAVPTQNNQVYTDPQGRQFMMNPQGQAVYLQPQQVQQMQRPAMPPQMQQPMQFMPPQQQMPMGYPQAPVMIDQYGRAMMPPQQPMPMQQAQGWGVPQPQQPMGYPMGYGQPQGPTGF